MLQFLNHNTAHYKRYNNDRLVMRDVIRHDALLWLVIFFNSSDWHSYKTSPWQHQQGWWNRNSRSVDAHDQKTQQREIRAKADRLGSKLLSETARIVMRQSELLKKQPITAEHHALEDHAWPVDPIAWRRLAVCSRNAAIYITCDYIVRQTEHLAFIVIHYDE